MPLVFVLADMEYEGVSIDCDELKNITQEFNGKIYVIEKEIYDLPSSCLFFVPDESIELYKATDIWRVYEDRIFNLSEKTWK